MKRLVVATGNKGKVKEINKIMDELGLSVETMSEAGINIEIEENGKTFEENAIIKSEALMAYTDAMILADDSGLEIDYLNKEPGVYSARYLGEDTSYDIKNRIILERLEGVPKEERTARFVCAIALSKKGEETIVVRDTIEGYIGFEAAGDGGFGYDPIFFVEEYNKSLAQLSIEEKNKISHRGKALVKVKKYINEILERGN